MPHHVSRRVVAAAALLLSAAPAAAGAQWVRTHEQFYLPAEHNWVFRTHYPAADRLFNAFDYGHAVLYEVLWTKPDAPASRLEDAEYRFIVDELLTNPPPLPLPEETIEPHYARLAPEAKAMFEWAHVLHRQIYDVLGDERLSEAGRDSAVAAIMRYYHSRPDLAFSRRPKSMELMEGQPYSLAFRERYPKFNGLIWAYHWLQVGLYEPLLTGTTSAERQTGVLAAVARFRQMLESPPSAMPRVMPMTAAVAPAFAARYPEAAIVFDNLHGMHDVISDILANPEVPRSRKRAEILLAGERYRDDTSYVTTVEEWLAMSVGMGVEAQGGRATGFMPPPTVPTAPATAGHEGHGATGGAQHGGMQHGGMQHDSAGHGGMQHDSTQHGGMRHGAYRDSAQHDSAHRAHQAQRARADSGHAGHAAPAAPAARSDSGHDAHAGHAAPRPAPDNAARDSTFALLQERGRQAMGVDQYTSTHTFEPLPDGGRIRLVRDDPADTAGVRTIRLHMRDIAALFARGDFSIPGMVHAGEVPGTRTMAAHRAHIRYEPRDVPGGGEVRITTTDPGAVAAVHEFLAYQNRDHRAGHH